MARNTSSRQAKTATTNPSKPPPPPPTPSSTPSSSTTPPSPFTPAPPALVDHFLTSLPKSHIYLTTIDTSPPSLKKRAFAVPTVLNTFILLALSYRLITILPTYLTLFITIFGHPTPLSTNTATTPLLDLAAITTQRTFFIFFDYALFSLLGAWPYEFLFGSKTGRYVGPVSWRRAVRFQENEIIVRRSRKWDATLAVQTTVLNIDEQLTLKHKITPAMAPSFTQKTGYAMLDRNWDLDFAGMVTAHSASSTAELKMEDFKGKAFMYSHSLKCWMIWDVHAKTQYTPATSKQQATMEKFKEKLTSMGQEELFYRWIEIVQYESSSPGGWTEGRRASAMREAKRIFEEKGVDFAKFWEEVGGSQGMPGLDDDDEQQARLV